MKLFFGNLPRDMNDTQLSELVVPFGTPESATVILDRETLRCRGFGFVEFRTAGEGQAAIAGLNGKEMSGKALVVNESRPQKRMW